VRTCEIEPQALSTAERWISERRKQWEQRLDRLGEFLAEQPQERRDHPSHTKKRRST
jgi:hypothetical protein